MFKNLREFSNISIKQVMISSSLIFGILMLWILPIEIENDKSVNCTDGISSVKAHAVFEDSIMLDGDGELLAFAPGYVIENHVFYQSLDIYFVTNDFIIQNCTFINVNDLNTHALNYEDSVGIMTVTNCTFINYTTGIITEEIWNYYIIDDSDFYNCGCGIYSSGELVYNIEYCNFFNCDYGVILDRSNNNGAIYVGYSTFETGTTAIEINGNDNSISILSNNITGYGTGMELWSIGTAQIQNCEIQNCETGIRCDNDIQAQVSLMKFREIECAFNFDGCIMTNITDSVFYNSPFIFDSIEYLEFAGNTVEIDANLTWFSSNLFEFVNLRELDFNNNEFICDSLWGIAGENELVLDSSHLMNIQYNVFYNISLIFEGSEITNFYSNSFYGRGLNVDRIEINLDDSVNILGLNYFNDNLMEFYFGGTGFLKINPQSQYFFFQSTNISIISTHVAVPDSGFFFKECSNISINDYHSEQVSIGMNFYKCQNVTFYNSSFSGVPILPEALDSYAIKMYSSQIVMITELIVSHLKNGIIAEWGENHTISSCQFTQCEIMGIDYSTITNLQVESSNFTSAHLSDTRNFYTNITNNHFVNASVYSILRANGSITQNVFLNGGIQLRVEDTLTSHMLADNIVNGKPIMVYTNDIGKNVNLKEIGQLILYDCTNYELSQLLFGSTVEAITILHSLNITILDIQIDYCEFGVYAKNTANVVIKNISISNCKYGLIIEAIEGLTLTSSYIEKTIFSFTGSGIKEGLLEYNTMKNGDLGISIHNSECNISYNRFSDFENFGIMCSFCPDIIFLSNRVYLCKIGLLIDNSDNCYLYGNLIYNNVEKAISFFETDSIYLISNFLLMNGGIDEFLQISYEYSTFETGCWNIDQPTADFDMDGISNLLEIQNYETNPMKSDSDGDLFSDGIEIAQDSDPLNSSDIPGDLGYLDLINLLNSLNGNVAALQILVQNLGIMIGDTDYDGLSDLDELFYNTSITCVDTDCDNLNDAFEIKMGTDPLNDDTDGDSWYDGIEAAAGTNPLDAADYPGAETETTSPHTTSDSDLYGNSNFPYILLSGILIFVVGLGMSLFLIIRKKHS